VKPSQARTKGWDGGLSLQQPRSKGEHPSQPDPAQIPPAHGATAAPPQGWPGTGVQQKTSEKCVLLVISRIEKLMTN